MLISKDLLPAPFTPDVMSPFGHQHTREFQLTLQQQLSTHGPAEFTLERAAAGLTGLLIVAAAMGERPTNFHIAMPENGASPHLVFSEWTADYLAVPVGTDTAPLHLLKIAAHTFAGKAGETRAHLLHGASEVLNVYRGTVATMFLDYIFKVPMNTHMLRVSGYTNEAVDRNDGIFDELFSALVHDEKIAQSYFQGLINQVVRLDVAPLVGRLQ